MNRRDFLKLTSASTGGIILSSCGFGGGTSGGIPAPNGYRFFRIAGPGSALPDGTTVEKIGEGSMMNDNAEILLFANNSSGRGGMYELLMDYSGETPVIAADRKVVAEGDSIGGHELTRICYGSTNRLGQHACVLKMTTGLNGVYADRDKTGMRPLVLPTGVTSETDDPDFTFHGHYGDVDMDNQGNIIMKAAFHTEAMPVCREGLIHIDAATGKKTVLAEEGDQLPSGDEKIQAFGLVDISDSNGHYAAQVFGPGQGPGQGIHMAGAASGLKKAGSTSMIRGNVSSPFLKSKTLAASAGASLKKSQRAAVLTGEVNYGPRIGIDGRVAQVIHLADNFAVLYFDGKEVISTGGTSPLGNVVKTIGAPIVAESGLLYFLLESANNIAELCIYNGFWMRTVLATGDPVDSSGQSVPIKAFAFGALRDMMDNAGRLVMTGAFDDGLHVVVGIPY